jgi:hypothetical protein
MHAFFASMLALAAVAAASAAAESSSSSYPPVSPSAANARLFSFRGRTLALVGSGEHYGAVLNVAMNFTAYLDAESAHGLNLVRTWTGAVYREPWQADGGSSFGIVNNTLAPAPGDYLAPWAVSGQCCYNSTPGVNKYDLTAFNQAYFDRLRAYLLAAGERGIVVNLGLFCVFYSDRQSAMWPLSPFYPGNNINGVGGNVSDPNDMYTGAHPELEAFMSAFIQRLFAEVGDLDNFFVEVMNEPYATSISGQQNLFLPWQSRMIDAIVAADTLNPLGPHTVAQNLGQGLTRFYPGSSVLGPDPRTRYVSTHYTHPAALAANYRFPYPLGTSETGFEGHGDAAYRARAWSTVLSGAATYSNLDYSFNVAHPDGTGVHVPDPTPGGGGPAFRAQMGVLVGALNDPGFPLETAAPATREVLAGFGGWPPCADLQFYILADGASSPPVLNVSAALVYISGFTNPLYPSSQLPLTLQLQGSVAAAVGPGAASASAWWGRDGAAPTYTVWALDLFAPGNRTAITTSASVDVNGCVSVGVPFHAPPPGDGGNDAAILVVRNP